jgi:hypothetical protein
MIVDELNSLNQRLKPRNVKETMLKTGSYVCICEKSVMGDLITDYTTSGVKLTGLQHGLLYGTREIAIAAMSYSTIAGVRMTPDSGDGLSCSSDEVVERQWSQGLSLFGLVVNANHFIMG